MVAGIYVAMFSALTYLAFKATTGSPVPFCGSDGCVVRVEFDLCELPDAWQHEGGSAGTGAGICGNSDGTELRTGRLVGCLFGYRLAGMHGLLPAWMIPSATLALVTWIGVVAALTRPHAPIVNMTEFDNSMRRFRCLNAPGSIGPQRSGEDRER